MPAFNATEEFSPTWANIASTNPVNVLIQHTKEHSRTILSILSEEQQQTKSRRRTCCSPKKKEEGDIDFKDMELDGVKVERLLQTHWPQYFKDGVFSKWKKLRERCLASKNIHLQAVGKHLRNFQRDFSRFRPKYGAPGLGRVIAEAVLYFRGFDLKKLNLGARDCVINAGFSESTSHALHRLLSLGNSAVHYDTRDSTRKDYVDTLRNIFTVLSLGEVKIADEILSGNGRGAVVQNEAVSGEFQAWLNARRAKANDVATKWQAIGRRCLIHLFARQVQRRMAALKVQRGVRGFLRRIRTCRILAVTTLQAISRRWLTTRHSQKKAAGVKVQSFVRGSLVRRRRRKKRETLAARKKYTRLQRDCQRHTKVLRVFQMRHLPSNRKWKLTLKKLRMKQKCILKKLVEAKKDLDRAESA
jgi:hypothetical protein